MTEPDPPREPGSADFGPHKRALNDPEQQTQSAEMDAEIIALRRRRVPFDEIGRLMALKYRHDMPDQPFRRQSMHGRYRKALAKIPARAVEAHRAELNELLDELLDQVNTIAQKTHLAHSNGRVVELDGEPVTDDGPKLQAIAEARKIIAEIKDLNGLKVPVRQEIGLDATVQYQINGVDVGKLT